MNGHNIGSFKSSKPEAYAILREIAKFELNKNNFADFLVSITNETLKYESHRTHFSFTSTRFISDCRDLDFLFCGEASNNLADKKECFAKFMTAADSIYDQDISISQVLSTPIDSNQQQPSMPQTGITLRSQTSPSSTSLDNSLADSIINSNSFISFFKKLNEEMENTVSTRVANEISRHFGVERDLTSDMIERQQQDMSNTYNKILRKKNDIQIFATHAKRKTTPAELCHKKFPRPFLQHDVIFVDKYNILIDRFQTEIMNLAMERH